MSDDNKCPFNHAAGGGASRNKSLDAPVPLEKACNCSTRYLRAPIVPQSGVESAKPQS
jgi:hypothetical protein